MSTPTLRVRPGRPSDAEALRVVRLGALADSPGAFGDTWDDCATWSHEEWAAKAAQWNFYLAEDHGRVVGMARGEVHHDRPDSRWLFAMYVVPDARGGAAARDLVDTVSAWARIQGVDALHLYVSSSMARARAFYAKMGFVETGDTVARSDDDPRVFVEMRRPLEDFAVSLERVPATSLYDLRRRVLRGDDPLVDVTNDADQAATTSHYGVLVGRRVVVGASFFAASPPFGSDEGAYQLRYMATDFDVQGRGLGTALLAHALEELRGAGVRLVWANARTTALDFYRATGWSVLDNSLHVSAETGIDHVVIHRSVLTPSASH
jgi:GNAT superfamily N-acetyltransferase